jgi:glycosyltransferase involved in cell wall biosynthesis
MRLTVAIPTFDRNAILRANLERLVPQLTPQCRLLVLDNCSPTPAAETLAPLLAAHPDVSACIVRHPVNIGGNANVLRCFELCQTEYVWVLGDDDAVEPDAIARIFRDLDEHPGVRYVNYVSELYEARRESYVTVGPDDFVARMDSLSNALFLSASVFDARAVRQQMRLAYAYAYSNAPHLVSLLAALGPGDACFYSAERIAHWEPAPHAHRWSTINAALAFPTLLDVPMRADLREKLSEKLDAIQPPLEGLVRQLLFLALDEGDTRTARYCYAQICKRRYQYKHGFGPWLRSKVYAPLLLVPRLASPLVELAARALLGARAGENRLQDRLGRI